MSNSSYESREINGKKVIGEQRGQRDAHAEDALGRDVQGPDKRVNMRAELLIGFAAVAVVFRDPPALEDVSIHVDGAVISCSRCVDRNLCNWIFNRIVNKGDQDGIQRYL